MVSAVEAAAFCRLITIVEVPNLSLCSLCAAVIVGAGPSGAVCAYFLAKAGAKVALLEKEKFPRDK